MNRIKPNSPYYHLSVGGFASQAERDAKELKASQLSDGGASEVADLLRKQHRDLMAVEKRRLAVALEQLESSLRQEELLERLLDGRAAKSSRRKVSNAVDSFNWQKFMREPEKEARELLQKLAYDQSYLI